MSSVSSFLATYITVVITTSFFFLSFFAVRNDSFNSRTTHMSHISSLCTAQAHRGIQGRPSPYRQLSPRAGAPPLRGDQLPSLGNSSGSSAYWRHMGHVRSCPTTHRLMHYNIQYITGYINNPPLNTLRYKTHNCITAVTNSSLKKNTLCCLVQDSASPSN